MNKFALILSGHDDSCCRSHSIRNILLLIKVNEYLKSKKVHNSVIDVYVHPSEFLILYKLIINKIIQNSKIRVIRNCNSLSGYDLVFGCFSTVFKNLKHNNVYIYDPSLSESFIKKSLDNVNIL